MLHKTLAETIETAREVVAEAGEGFVYTEHYDTCYYSVEGKPACLVGRILAKWGVLPADVDSKAVSSRRMGLFAESLLFSMGKSGELSVSDDVTAFLAELQRHQDAGRPWGDALGLAIEYVQ